MTRRTSSGRKIKPENAVQRAVTDLLAAERILFFRQQSRTFMVPGEGGRTRPMFVGWPGMADLVAFPIRPVNIKLPETSSDCRLAMPVILWVECKSPVGKQSEDQKLFQEEVCRHGHHYIVARSSDDVLAWLKEYGARGL